MAIQQKSKKFFLMGEDGQGSMPKEHTAQNETIDESDP